MAGQDTGIGGARAFPTTRWTLILGARAGTDQKQRALEELLAIYWKPLYWYARRKGHDPESAQDVIQGFLARMLEKDFLARVDPGKGRLRGYLKTALGNYLVNLHEHDTAQRRGGEFQFVDFDVAERALPDTGATPEEMYDRQWALAVLDRALERLREEFASGERKGPFDVAAKFFRFEQTPSYKEIAAEHHMTIPQLKSFLHRTRTRYRELVSEEIADTLADADEVNAELAELLKTL